MICLPFDKSKNSHDNEYKVDPNRITDLVEHPIPIKPVASKVKEEKARPLSMNLIPEERKKLRRRMRQQKAQEMRDKVKMGLVKQPPPKVKLANLMRVMGDNQIANPTAIEAQVRQQVDERNK